MDCIVQDTKELSTAIGTQFINRKIKNQNLEVCFCALLWNHSTHHCSSLWLSHLGKLRCSRTPIIRFKGRALYYVQIKAFSTAASKSEKIGHGIILNPLIFTFTWSFIAFCFLYLTIYWYTVGSFSAPLWTWVTSSIYLLQLHFYYYAFLKIDAKTAIYLHYPLKKKEEKFKK